MLPAVIQKGLQIGIDINLDTCSFKYPISIPLITPILIGEFNNPIQQLNFSDKNKIAIIIACFNPPDKNEQNEDKCESDEKDKSDKGNGSESNEKDESDEKDESNEGDKDSETETDKKADKKKKKKQTNDKSEQSDSDDSESNEGDDSEDDNGNKIKSQLSKDKSSSDAENSDSEDSKDSSNSNSNSLSQESANEENEDDDISQDELERIKEMLDCLNVEDNQNESFGGPADNITANRQRGNDIIKRYVGSIIKNGKRTLATKSHIIDGRKAAIALIIKPHTVIEKFKIKKRKPKIYALIDSHTSDAYGYHDNGSFLNQFAQTCVELKIETWRSEKLSKNYYMETGSKKLGGYLTHSEWAKQAKIKKGSFILLVGDGCLGGATENETHRVWSKEELDEFAKTYNPFWVHMYKHGTDCGCKPTSMAEKSNFKFEYGIKTIGDLAKKLKI